MSGRLQRFWDETRSSMGFIPALLTIGATMLALMMVRLDHVADPDAAGLGWLVFGGGPEGAQGVLSAIASSVVTVVGVIFSVTIVALTLASQQFTPRVLRQFTSDRGIQAVLGIFLGTFVYCLLVLRTVRSSDFGEFIPHFAVTVGVVLAVVSLGMLLFFIHHVSRSIQVGYLLERIAAETHAAVDHLFPEPLGRAADPEHPEPQEPPGAACPLRPGSGYLQVVDGEPLLKALEEHDLTLRLERRVGEFVPWGATLATVWPVERVRPEVRERLAGALPLGPNRTPAHDAEFGVVQIVDIAVKALSPGINDPTTAQTCIQHLTGILIHLGRRQIPSPCRKDARGVVRLIAPGPGWERMLGLAYDAIRHYGRADARILGTLLQSMGDVAREVEDPGRRAVLLDQVLRTEALAVRGLEDPREREDLRRLAAEIRQQNAGMPSAPRLRLFTGESRV